MQALRSSPKRKPDEVSGLSGCSRVAFHCEPTKVFAILQSTRPDGTVADAQVRYVGTVPSLPTYLCTSSKYVRWLLKRKREARTAGKVREWEGKGILIPSSCFVLAKAESQQPDDVVDPLAQPETNDYLQRGR